jgi:predicted ATP-binding protein involved in virulence
MIITRITLTNYRGASSLLLPLHPRLNVFYGSNGSGKSTVLDAAALMLSWWVGRLKHERGAGSSINENSIANGKPAAQLDISCLDGTHEFTWRLVKARTGHGHAENRSDFASLNTWLAGWQRQIAASSAANSPVNNAAGNAVAINLPLCVYYPINRAVLDIPLRIRQRHVFSVFSAYDDALTSAANFRTFFEWFREREDLENEQAREVERTAGERYQDVQLQAVRDALAKFMPDFTELTVRRNPLRMEVQKKGKRLLVDQLSDGEKCLIALVGDLARRLAIANPLREQPLSGDGVVLIDEIDLHLHPDWQGMLIERLQQTFPACQFLLTTHSPHVISNVQPESLFCLRQAEGGMVFEQPRESYGKNADRVLEDIMGLSTTRPEPVQASLRQMFEAISRGELQQAREQISALRGTIGNDPDLGKAEVLIRRKELVGR